MCTNTLAETTCSKKVYILWTSLYRNINICSLPLLHVSTPGPVYSLSLASYFCSICLCRSDDTATAGSIQRWSPIVRPHFVHYATSGTERLLFRPLTHILLCSVIQLLLSYSVVVFLARSTASQAHPPSFSCISSSGGFYSMCCRRTYSVLALYVWMFRRINSSPLAVHSTDPPSSSRAMYTKLFRVLLLGPNSS